MLQTVLTATRFKLRYTSPSENYPILFHCLPRLTILEPALDLVMDLAMTEPELC